MTDNLISLPTTTGVIAQQPLIEALGGPRSPTQYLDRFPDEIYNKAPDSHLVRFLYSLLGPAGVGQLHANYLRARLMVEDHGLEAFDLEGFLGNPFRFGRILGEMYESDPSGLLTQEEWDLIRSKDARYRSRATDFFNAARAGTSPEGMRLASRGGLGHDVAIIENYRYLFDQRSDEPLGLDYFGQTNSTEEMIVLPRREASRSEVQQIALSGQSGGYFQLQFRGKTTNAISWSATPEVDAQALKVQDELEALTTIGRGNVIVTGGPTKTGSTLYVLPYVVLFTGALAGSDIPLLTAVNSLTGTSPTITIETTTNGVDSADEVVHIPDADKHALQTALSHLKPVTTIPTTYPSTNTRRAQPWASVASTSESVEVLRFVTGQSGVNWPSVDSKFWIEHHIEKQGPRPVMSQDRHYVAFHSIPFVIGSSEYVGQFGTDQAAYFPYLKAFMDDTLVLTADRAVADYAEPLYVTTSDSGVLLQDIYPIEYTGLSGVPTIKYRDEQFWASEEATTGDEELLLDLGTVQAVNLVTFEVASKPLNITVFYDIMGGVGDPSWIEVTPYEHKPWTSGVSYIPDDQNQWSQRDFRFTDGLGHPIFTRYIRLLFSRRTDTNLPSDLPYSVDVRNVRVGRWVSA